MNIVVFAYTCDDEIIQSFTNTYSTPISIPIPTLTKIRQAPRPISTKTKQIVVSTSVPINVSITSLVFTPTTPTQTQTPTTRTRILTSVPTSSPIVQNINEYKFKFDDISKILQKHNDERNSSERNVTNILWSQSLKESSQIWSNNLASRGCILEHKLFSSAQNLYAGYGWIEPNLPNAMQAWLDEKSLLNKPNITFEEIGHYLIMISSNYNEVGCASSINIDNNCFVVTCNYN
jgi:uncharacterized protein YkwD